MKKKKQNNENTVEYGTVSLPLPLVEKVKKKIKGTGFPSVSAFVAFILRQLLSTEEVDVTELRERLKRLNYL